MRTCKEILYRASRVPVLGTLPDMGINAFKVSRGLVWQRGFANRTRDLLAGMSYLARQRESDVFILGTGKSVLDLTPEQIQRMKRGVTIGLNFWILHDLVPDIYYFEGARDPEERCLWKRTLEEKAPQYTGTAIAVPFFRVGLLHGREDLDLLKRLFPTNLYPVKLILTSIRNRRTAGIVIRSIRLGWLDHWLVHCRSSLAVALHLALRLPAVRRIILVGVDLLDNEYFWDSYDMGLSSTQRRRQAAPHATAVCKPTSITIVDYILALQNSLLHSRDRQLFVASEKSLLASHLPLFSFEDAC